MARLQLRFWIGFFIMAAGAILTAIGWIESAFPSRDPGSPVIDPFYYSFIIGIVLLIFGGVWLLIERVYRNRENSGTRTRLHYDPGDVPYG